MAKKNERKETYMMLANVRLRTEQGLKSDIIKTLHAFNKKFQEKYNEPLRNNLDELIKSQKLFSGSTL